MNIFKLIFRKLFGIKDQLPGIDRKEFKIKLDNNWINNKSIPSSNPGDNIIGAADLQQEVKEMPWFTRVNDLVNEFAFEPVPVYSNNLSSDEIVGYQLSDGRVVYREDIDDSKPTIIKEYKGYMITVFNKSELAIKIDRIDNGFVKEFLTIEEYNKTMEIDQNQLLADDVELLKNDPNYAKPKSNEKTAHYDTGLSSEMQWVKKKFEEDDKVKIKTKTQN